MRTKFKKLIALILAMAMCMSLFVGCSLVRFDAETISSQAFAVIQPQTFTLKNGETWTSDRIIITRKQVQTYFAANAGSYLGQMPLADIYKGFANILYNNAIMGIYAQKQAVEDSTKDLAQKQKNDLWKDIYEVIDSRLYTEMKTLATSFGEEAPIKPEIGDGTVKPKYPVKKTPEVTDSDEVIEKPWRAPVVKLPTDDKEKKETDLKLQATRNLLQKMIDEVKENSYLLTAEQKAALEEDRVKFAEIKLLPLHDAKVLSLYSDLQDYFAVRFLYYDQNIRMTMVDNLQKNVEKDVSEDVSNEDIVAKYNETIAAQKLQYSTVSAYTTALDAANSDTVLIYRPYDVKQFYVKHILVPFSDAQKNRFLATSTDTSQIAGLSAAELKARRASEAAAIRSYEHLDGFDVGSEISIDDIRKDIVTSVTAGDLTARDQAFENLIYKYNTDDGAFNNDLGYGLRRDNTESKYMAEFTKAANDLYDAAEKDNFQNFGGVVEAVTDYGVHFMILSDKMNTGTLELDDTYNVAKKKTVREYLKETIIKERKTDRFTTFKNVALDEMKKELIGKLSRNDAIIEQLIEEESNK